MTKEQLQENLSKVASETPCLFEHRRHNHMQIRNHFPVRKSNVFANFDQQQNLTCSFEHESKITLPLRFHSVGYGWLFLLKIQESR